jgi:hypothetical protein
VSSTDDGASRLSKMLDEVLGRSAPQEWSIDDPGRPAGPTVDPDTRTSDGNGDTPAAHESDGPRPVHEPSDDRPNEPPAGEPESGVDPDIPSDSSGAFVLPEIVPATTDVPEVEEPSLPTATSYGVPITVRDPDALVSAPPSARAPAPAPARAPAPAPAPAWNERTVPASPSGSLRTPGHRPRVRRVTRVIRHIDPWSTFKLALLFSLVAYVTALTSGILLWRVAESTGTLDNVERWFTQFGWETFEFKGGEIFHNAWIIGLFGVVAATGGAVLVVTLFNLVSDIVGGVRVTVLEEEVVERTISANRRYVVRRPSSVSEATGTAPAWDVDDGPAGGRSEAPKPTPTGSADGGATKPPFAAPSNWTVDDDAPPSAG